MESHGFDRILLATDGSRPAATAEMVAASLALASGGSVRVVHAWSLEAHERAGAWDLETRREAEALTLSVVDRLRALGVKAEALVSRADRDHVADAIADAADECEADLVVVGSRGLSDWQSLRRHSVSHKLLTAVECPVLVVREREGERVHQARNVLLAIAGGDDVEAGARAAAAAAAAPGSKVIVLHVAQAIVGVQGFSFVETDEEIEATVGRTMSLLAAAGVEAESMVAEPGAVASVVAATADEKHADMIVIGSSRMGDIASLLLGSVTHELLRATDRPVLVAEKAHA
jgi:nucleotide-binding universal stress UspA family protein